jgi:lysophospholipase L1-like esterase
MIAVVKQSATEEQLAQFIAWIENRGFKAHVSEGANEKIVGIIREKQPKAKIVMHPIFPRGCSAESARHAKARERNDRTNALLKEFAAKDGKVVWIDFNDKLVDASGWVPKSIMADEIHPTDAGYDVWMAALEPALGK